MVDIDDDLQRLDDMLHVFLEELCDTDESSHWPCYGFASVALDNIKKALRTKADSGRGVETEGQAAIRAALTNLVSACGKIPMARMTPFGYECPHCDAKAGESCRPKCWWPTIEAAIVDGQEALAAKGRG